VGHILHVTLYIASVTENWIRRNHHLQQAYKCELATHKQGSESNIAMMDTFIVSFHE